MRIPILTIFSVCFLFVGTQTYGESALKKQMAKPAVKKVVKPEVKKKPEPKKALTKPFDGRLALGTSFGLAGFVGTEATIGGVADVQVLYKLDMNILGPLYGSYRYLPMAVTIQETSEGRTSEYVGVIEGNLFGVQALLSGSKDMNMYVSAELGALKQALYDEVSDKSKLDVAMLLVAGAGVEWPIEQAFRVHGKFNVGVGTYTVWQLAGGVNLAF